MDSKQEELAELLDICAEWWKDGEVLTFDFGVDAGKLNLDNGDADARGRFVDVSEDTVRNMAKKKNAPKTDESTKSGLKILMDYCHNAGIVFPAPTATAVELNSVGKISANQLIINQQFWGNAGR